MHDYAWTLRDGWTVLADPPVVWGDDMSQTLNAAGYWSGGDAAGDEYTLGHIDIWYHQHTTPYPPPAPPPAYRYCCFVLLPGEALEVVWLQDSPTLFDFLRLYAPAVSLLHNQRIQTNIESILSKLFRAWHGHEADSMCRHCDPHAYEAWQRQEAQARKVAAFQASGR